MDAITWILLALAAAIASFILTGKLFSATKGQLPPGPKGMPLIGCPWIVLQDIQFPITEMAKKWGDVCMFNLLGQRIVVLNSAEVVREAFISKAMGETVSGRPPPPWGLDILAYSTVFLQPGQQWSKQRKLVHKILNMYGDGVQQMESTSQEELMHVIHWLKNKEVVNMDDIIYPSLANIITILLKGRRYEYGSRELENVILMDETGAKGGTIINTILFNVFPILKYLPIGPGLLLKQWTESTNQFLKDYFEEAKATYDPKVTRGMIDYLLRHQEESRLENGTVWMEDMSMKAVVQEMITAGTTTTRGALYSFFLIIAHHPEVAKRIQEEIDAVIVTGLLPSLEDRSRMPYTIATMSEFLRYISHIPTGVAHLTTQDVTLNGYFIPANTTVLPNTWKIHHDEKLWTDPWKFKPERFLDNDGNFVPVDHPNRKNLMPFGIGRRSCVGEVFARSRMFLFITTLLQKFNFGADPSRPLPSCDPRSYRPGIVKSPHTYYLHVISRN